MIAMKFSVTHRIGGMEGNETLEGKEEPSEELVIMLCCKGWVAVSFQLYYVFFVCMIFLNKI